ncbi:MAG: SDR family NAD(P)-dependent oxidoreductase, partial [Cyclobacteriaceae bacterium]|nr:SDR family NAD(P)-dependent oxidoreductase [Cyclobacteriaceae bacterium]
MDKKKALITGASDGIGKVFMQKLAEEGYMVTGVARNYDKLRAVVQSLPGVGNRFIMADLTDESQLNNVVLDLQKEGYQLLINNAGYGMYNRFHEMPLEGQLNMIDLNIGALVVLSHHFLKTAKPGDALINISSGLSLLTYPGGAAYAGSKAFVTNFTESLWYENKGRDVYVAAILPGATKTNFHNVAFDDPGKRPPESRYQSAEEVVEESLRVIKKRKKPSYITGAKNRFL